MCVCDGVQYFEAGPHVVVLQHPRERKRSIGTGRLVRLAIANSRIIEGAYFDGNRELRELLSDPRYFPVLLYPGGARIADLAAQAGAPSEKRWLILVADGTWATARSMLNRSRDLDGVPRIALEAPKPSNYRFRQQPARECVSTLEAVHLVLEELDACARYRLPEQRPHDQLLRLFDTMVEKQLECYNSSHDPILAR